MSPPREKLPSTRRSTTHKFNIAGHEGYLTVGFHQDGRPGEIFLKMAKEGSTLSGMCQAFCRAFSLSMQHGLSVPEAVIRFKGMRFEPMGPTRHPDIPEASSIVDYIARYLELLEMTDPPDNSLEAWRGASRARRTAATLSRPIV